MLWHIISIFAPPRNKTWRCHWHSTSLNFEPLSFRNGVRYLNSFLTWCLPMIRQSFGSASSVLVIIRKLNYLSLCVCLKQASHLARIEWVTRFLVCWFTLLQDFKYHPLSAFLSEGAFFKTNNDVLDFCALLAGALPWGIIERTLITLEISLKRMWGQYELPGGGISMWRKRKEGIGSVPAQA